MEQNILTILMIDDHPSMIEGYKSILAFNDLNAEIEVDAAYNCESAYHLIIENKSKKHYDFVFIDLSLPPYEEEQIYSGKELAHLVKLYMPSSKIVILTSHAESFLLYEIHKYVNPIGILVKSDFTADELLLAFSKMNANEFYRSKTVQQSIKDFLATNFVLDELNRQIITLLAQGIKTKNLPNHINLTLSAINKRKAQIRVFFNLDDSSDENIINAAKKRGFI